MFKSLKQLFQEAKSFNLSGDEKSLIWRELQMHVRNGLMARQHIYRSKLNIIKLTLIKPMPIFILILLALGGTSFAAEKALPGDVFYPVKLNVNEHVQGWLSLSDEAKANWETVLANRRLSEAEELAAHSKLDAKTEAQIESNFEQHANKAQEHIDELANVDAKAAADIAANLQTSLEAHNRILLNISTSKDKDGDTESQLEVIILKVKAEAKDASDDRNKNEEKVKSGADIQAAAEGRLNAAENKLTEVQKFVENKKDNLSADAMVQVQTQFKAASDLIAQGKAQLNAKAYAQAFTLFGQAKAKAQEVKLLIEAKTHFEDKDNADENDDKNDSDLSEDSSSQPSVSLNPSVFRGEGALRDREQNHRGSGKINIDIGL